MAKAKIVRGAPFYPDVATARSGGEFPPGSKATNPKDAFGSAKLPVGLAPDTAINEMALAFLEGALKYGRYNWRIAGVRASIYNDAMERHRQKWWNGENRDPLSKVKHLANQMACCAIVMDAEICGMLDDDRPPAAPVGEQHDELVKLVAHLKETFKDFNPTQYTEKEHGKPYSLAGVPAFTTVDVTPEHLERLKQTGIFRIGDKAEGIPAGFDPVYPYVREYGMKRAHVTERQRQRNRGVRAKRKPFPKISRAKLAKILKVKGLPRGTRRFG